MSSNHALIESVQNCVKRSKRRQTVWIFRMLIFAFCSTFCVLDIVHNVIYFLHRPFTVNTHLDYDQPLTLPSFTICIPNIVDLNSLKAKHPDVYRRYANISWDKYYWRPKFANELTIGQLRSMQPKFSEIFVNCSVLTNKLIRMPCQQVIPVQHYFSMAKYCYTFFEQQPQLRNSSTEYANQNVLNNSTLAKYWRKSPENKKSMLAYFNFILNSFYFYFYFVFDCKQ